MSDLERGIKYITDLWEREQQKTETEEETKARHRKMAETALLTLELFNQCPRCVRWDDDKIECKIHEKSIVNCPDWVQRSNES